MSNYGRTVRLGLNSMWAEFLSGINSKGDPTDFAPRLSDGWVYDLHKNENPNEQPKIMTVPADVERKIISVRIVHDSTGANAGNRQLKLTVLDENAEVVFEIRVGAVQAINLVRYYHFAPWLADLTAFRDTDWLSTPIPPDMVLPAGWQLVARDDNAISVTDDLKTYIHYAERAA